MPKFRGQDYGALRKACLKSGTLFEDGEFPANNKSLFYSKLDPDITWSRPKELCKVPRLVVEGVSCDDLNPGELGNSWFITACASLSQQRKIWQKVIPNYKDQEYDDQNQYAGIFRFNFWRYGEWTEVVIDDRLPTRGGKLIFAHSKSRNEFWSALLEKAYAKLFGDYESLRDGLAVDALVDFTGGVSERLDLSAHDGSPSPALTDLFLTLLEAADNQALIITSIQCSEADRGGEGEGGLVLGQGYTVTGVRQVEVKKSLQGALGTSQLRLLRLFNLWEAREWTGPWSDSSPQWKSLAPHEWDKMGIKFQNEGEFWMAVEDFARLFSGVELVHFVNTSFFSMKKSWSEALWHSQWSGTGRTGGGDYTSLTFLSNPQFMFDIGGVNDRIMVSLEQHDVKGREAMLGKMNTIGFHIMKVEDNRRYRVHVQGERMLTSDYVDARSVFGSLTLRRGRYVIVPSTKQTGASGHFMLRLYTGSNAGAGELRDEAPSAGCVCGAGPRLVTSIRVEQCQDLEPPPNSKGSFDPFVVVRCEGEKVQSAWVTATRSPQFDVSAIFYRKKPQLPIVIEVWNHNLLMNDFVCQATCDKEVSEAGASKVLSLYGRKKEAETKMGGKMTVFLRSSHDLAFL